MTKIPYYEMLRKHGLIMIKEIFSFVDKNGLSEDNCLIFSCITFHPDIVIPDKVKEKYPAYITLIIDEEFSGFRCDEKGFHVTLNFRFMKNVSMYIPFDSLISFEDEKQKIIIPLPIEKELTTEIEKRKGN